MDILTSNDALSSWKDKINNQIFASEIVKSYFYDPAQSYTPDVLDFFVEGGVLKSGNTFVSVVAAKVRLLNNTVNWVVINTTPAGEAIEVYADGSVPASEVIPLYRVTVDGSFNVTLIEDLKTWAIRV